MALDDNDKTSVRRHLGYPAIGLYRMSVVGTTLADGANAYRYFTGYGQLEFRMNNLMPDEEARLMGKAYGSVAILGVPVNGDVITVTITSPLLANPEVVPVTVAGMLPNPQQDPNIVNQNALVVTQLIAIALSSNANLIAANFLVVAPYGGGPFSQRFYPNPIVALTCPSGFTIAVTGPGNDGLSIRQTGKPLPPFYTQNAGSPTATTFYGYIPILDQLEAAQAGSSDNLDTIRADVWYARSTELRERGQLYNMWRHKMSQFLNIPLAENTGAMTSKKGMIRL